MEQITLIFAGLNGYFDDIPVSQVGARIKELRLFLKTTTNSVFHTYFGKPLSNVDFFALILDTRLVEHILKDRTK
jgi:hypothetical protein